MLSFGLSLFLGCVVANASPQIIINHPNSVSPFLGIVSDYSPEIADASGQLVYHSTDNEGCCDWGSIHKTSTNLVIGIVDRGTCTFLEKTRFAQSAGLDALFIVSHDDILLGMSADQEELQAFDEQLILTAMVTQSFKLFMQSKENEKTAITINPYNRQIWDTTMLIMIIVSSVLVAIGAYYSSDVERAQMYPHNNTHKTLRRRAPIQTISAQMAWSFIIVASVGLLTLYFFVSKIFMLFVVIFCISATNGLSSVFSHFIDVMFPDIQHTTYYIQRIDLSFNLSDILGFIPAIMVSVVWYISRHENFAWILQNIMCVGLLLVLQRSIRLTNLKIASILLCTAFLYDIFWVFLSPLLFESSVMVAVATYKHEGVASETLPVVLQLPRINDAFHSPMILGLGDIALPGLLVSYLLRYDYQMKVGISCSLQNGYFVPSLIGYAIGMMLTDINLILMQSGQPALLFLVPCTLGTTVFLAYRRGDFHYLWNNISDKYNAPQKSSISNAGI